MTLLIGLSVVIVAYDGEKPRVLTTRREGDLAALPFGAFDPDQHRTFELALRGWVREQTGFQLGHVEQLYTFGDRDRESPDASMFDVPGDVRIVSVGYLALTQEAERLPDTFEARWRGWYRHFPWEDHRHGRPAILDQEVIPHLMTWAAGHDERRARVALAFGVEGKDWNDEAVLERYEMLYEAGLVDECARDRGLPLPGLNLGEAMASDHRRILATAMSRLRAKIRYRPVIFDLMPDRFTLSALQRTIEAVIGQSMHAQNFRRALDRTKLVEGTGEMQSSTGGRPAELFRVRTASIRGSFKSGLRVPVQRSDT